MLEKIDKGVQFSGGFDDYESWVLENSSPIEAGITFLRMKNLPDVFALCEKQDVDINAIRVPHVNTVLFESLLQKSPIYVEKSLRLGSRVDAELCYINAAVELGSFDVVLKIIDRAKQDKVLKKVINKQDDFLKNTPLHIAIENQSDIGLVYLLLQSGARLDVDNNYNISPFYQMLFNIKYMKSLFNDDVLHFLLRSASLKQIANISNLDLIKMMLDNIQKSWNGNDLFFKLKEAVDAL